MRWAAACSLGRFSQRAKRAGLPGKDWSAVGAVGGVLNKTETRGGTFSDLRSQGQWAGDPSLATHRGKQGREAPRKAPARSAWTPPNTPKTRPSTLPMKGGENKDPPEWPHAFLESYTRTWVKRAGNQERIRQKAWRLPKEGCAGPREARARHGCPGSGLWNRGADNTSPSREHLKHGVSNT